MVDEYIERIKAIDACFDGWNNDAHDCAENIRLIPAADARLVVLCQQCENWDSSWEPNCGKEYGHFCFVLGIMTCSDWYCADGKRKEESAL